MKNDLRIGNHLGQPTNMRVRFRQLIVVPTATSQSKAFIQCEKHGDKDSIQYGSSWSHDMNAPSANRNLLQENVFRSFKAASIVLLPVTLTIAIMP